MPDRPPSRARLVSRAGVIGCLVLKHLLRWLIGWLALLVTCAGRARRRAWFGQVVLDVFRELGATFVKLGQIMSTRPDLVPEHVRLALERLQDDVGPFPFDAVVRTLETDFGQPMAATFAEFSPQPLASASVAQVHRARLHDGRVVAVKVRRPEVVQLCFFDLAVMKAFARGLEWLPSLRSLRPSGAVEQFARAVLAQLDFRIEARNNRRFRANFAGHPEVVFPEVVDGLSSARVLTMSFIEGRKILSRGAALPSATARRVARLGLSTMLKMIFEDGFVHADLHPGNIFVTRDERLALVDLGLVGELDDPHRRAFARFFAAWVQRDADTMAQLMLEVAVHDGAAPGAEQLERYRDAVAQLVERTWGHKMGDIHVGRVLFDMLGILRQHRIRANPTFTLVNIAIAVTEGIARQLDPELDLMSEALPYFLSHPVQQAAGD